MKLLILLENSLNMAWIMYWMTYSRLPNKRGMIITVLPMEFLQKFNSPGPNNCLGSAIYELLING